MKSQESLTAQNPERIIDEIPEGWEIKRLSEVCSKIGSGATPRGGKESYSSSGVSLIRSQNVLNEGFSESGLAFIDNSQAKELDNVSLVSKDILLNITGESVARCCIVPERVLPARVNQHVSIVRPIRDHLDPKFLRYFLISQKMQQHMLALASAGATRQALTKGMIEDFEIPCPSLEEQRAIAKILGDLDEKIELNHRMNKTLEAIAQALFKRWFVDFNFPDGKGRPYKDSGGRMVDSELGAIPADWDVKAIADCGEVICGKTPPTADKENYGADIFFITIPDMRGQAFVIQTERKISHRGASSQKNKELPPLAICVSCIATPGLVSLTSDVSHTNQQINSIVCKKEISPYFMYYTMLDKSEEIKTMGLGGTATLNLNTGNFARIKVVIPGRTTMKVFHELVTPIMERLLSNSRENKSLGNIHDSLLPKLMSGKIRVKAEKIEGATT